MKNNEEKDIYIEAIKLGKDRLQKKLKTSTYDLDEHLKSKGFHVPDGEFLNGIFLDVFGTQFMRNRSLPNEPSYLNSDAYFKWLDYEELKQARKSSAEAKKMAIWAICISGIFAFISIVLTITQMTYTTKVYLDEDQYNEIKSSLEIKQ